MNAAAGGADGFAANMMAGIVIGDGSTTPRSLQPQSFRQLLQTATGETHQRLHHHSGLSAVQDGTISRSDYRSLLERLHGFHRAFELAAGLTAERSVWLALDIEALGGFDQPGGSPPLCPAMPDFDTAESVLGALYVVEGSALGGRSLARGLDRLLGPGTPHGRRFFEGRGQETGAAWRAFLVRLEHASRESSARAAVIESAVETFSVFEKWLNGWSTADAS